MPVAGGPHGILSDSLQRLSPRFLTLSNQVVAANGMGAGADRLAKEPRCAVAFTGLWAGRAMGAVSVLTPL